MHRKGRAPSQRFRFEQYLDFLKAHGYDSDYSFLISKEDDKHYHGKGNILRKVWIGVKALLIRFRDVLHMNRYDIIFISRRAFLTESMFFERLFRLSHAKIVFDLDDAIWIDAVSHYNRRFAWLKGTSNTANVIRISDHVIAGNQYLADFSKKYNSNITIIPTTIDTDLYVPSYNLSQDPVVIGWSGSWSTIQHFRLAIPALQVLRTKYGTRIRIKVIGDGDYKEDSLGIIGLPWVEETEIADLQEMHIGIMPLPDDQWSWGKCGLKGLQYMALEIPTIMSPVGVNKEIIEHGKNGFLCTTTEEWVEVLERLVLDWDLRISIGKAGRRTVVDRYSVIANRSRYLSCFDQVTGNVPPLLN